MFNCLDARRKSRESGGDFSFQTVTSWFLLTCQAFWNMEERCWRAVEQRFRASMPIWWTSDGMWVKCLFSVFTARSAPDLISVGRFHQQFSLFVLICLYSDSLRHSHTQKHGYWEKSFYCFMFFFLHVEHNVSWKPHKESFVFVHWIPSSDLTEQSEKPTWAVMILEKSMRIFCTCCLCFISALSCPHSPHRGSYADAGIKTPRAVMAQIKADRLRRSHYATLCISCLSLYGL